jgi:hypothetical protein
MSSKSRPCQRCKAMIPAERVEALPQTRLCVKCSQERGSDVGLRVSTKNQGKAGSLKQTGVDIASVEWERKEVLPDDEEGE